MTSVNKYFYLVAIACLTALFFSGCSANRTTTRFMATPMESINEDLSIDPGKLTRELDDEMMSQNKRRRTLLLDKAKAEAEKNKKSGTTKLMK